MTQYTDRDALVIMCVGSSNMAGWQTDNDLVVSDTLTPATLPNIKMWGRYNSGNKGNLNGSYDWEDMTSTRNFQATGMAPPYAIGRKYYERFYSPAAKGQPVSAPKNVYIIQFAFSTMRCPLDTATEVSPNSAIHPGSENVSDTPLWQIFAEGYMTEAIQNLQDDPSIDRILYDGFYYLGDETAAYDPGTVAVPGAFASQKTRFMVAGGLQDMVAATEFYLSVPRGSLPFVGVKPPVQYIINAQVNATTGLQDIRDVRDQYDRFLEISPNSAQVIDGNDFTLKTDDAHYTAEAMLRVGEALYAARQRTGSQPIQATADVRTAVVPIDTDE